MLWTILAALSCLHHPAPVAPHDTADTGDTDMPATTTYPASPPVYIATDPGRRATLTVTRQDMGWDPGQPLPGLELNAAAGSFGDWLNYIAANVMPGSGILEAEYLRGNGTDDLVVYGNTRPMYVASEDDVEIIAGDGTGAQVLTSFQLGTDAMAFGTYDAGNPVDLPNTASFTGYAAKFAWTRAGGFAITDLRVTSGLVDAEDGVVAEPNSTTGLHYAYDTAESMAYRLMFGGGGWSQIDTGGSGGNLPDGPASSGTVDTGAHNLHRLDALLTTSAGYYGRVGALDGSAATSVFRMPLAQMLGLPSSASGTVYHLVALSADVAVRDTDDVVYLCIRDGADALVASSAISRTNTTGSLEAATLTTTFGGAPVAVSASSELYLEVQLYTETAVDSISGVGQIVLSIWQAGAL